MESTSHGGTSTNIQTTPPMTSQFRIPVFFLVCIFCFSCGSVATLNEQPLAENGVLDLQGWNFEKDGPVSLNGEWSFFWNQLLNPVDVQLKGSPEMTGYITVPGIWNGFIMDGKPLDGEGYATFRLLIRTDPQKSHLALKALEMAHAYKMWINGKAVLANGVVGTSQETMIPRFRPEIAVVQTNNGQIDILLQVSNFVHKRGGVWNAFELGTMKQIQSIKEENLLVEFVLFGSILMMGLYHLGLYFLRRKDPSPLYFGGFCLMVALRVLLIGERVMHVYMPWIGWSWLYKLELLTFYLAAPTFIVFLGSVIPEVKPLIQRIALIPSLVFAALIVVADVYVASGTLVYYQVFIVLCSLITSGSLVLAVFHGRKGALIILIGSLILFLTLVYDILESNLMFQGENLASFGLLIFIFCQSFMLSERFSKSFDRVEELSNHLDYKVKQRTQSLNEANEKIRRSMEELQETQSQLIQAQKKEAIGTLAGGIAHDFNTMIGTILGYTSVIAKEIPKGSIVHEDLDSINKVALQAKRLVRQIKDFSQYGSIEKRPLEIVSTVQSSLSFVRTIMHSTVNIEETYKTENQFVEANENQINQIIVNLCTNATDFMTDNHQLLRVTVEKVTSNADLKSFLPVKADSYILLSIADNGSGIDPTEMDRIFDPFYTTKDIGKGSGLGLAIVQNIVLNHNGWIRVESELEKGTTFFIYLPLMEGNDNNV